MYDDRYLYFAARCYDERPDLISAAETKRGGSIGNDDHLSFNIDLTGQQRVESAWYFKVTANGTQSELVPGGSASKQEWRGDWIAASRIDSLGWTTEAAVPLALFRHPGGAQDVAIYVDRWIPRYQEWAAWPNMGDNYDLSRAGRYTGMRFPATVNRPFLMPYGAAEASGSGRTAYLGVDFKHSTRSGLTLVGTVNPDHRNVETEVLSLGFSYGERFRADNRPFFVEGGKFTPESRIFYSQRVGEMYGGGKVIGSSGQHSYGVLTAFDRDRVAHATGRWYFRPHARLELDQSFAVRASESAQAPVGYLPASTGNLAAESRAVRTWLRGPVTHTWEVRGALTQTVDTVGTGYDIYTRYQRDGGNGGVSTTLGYQWTSPDWLAMDGLFDPELRNLHQTNASLSYSLQTDGRHIRKWSLSTSGGTSVRPGGDVFTRSVSASGTIEAPGGITLSGGPSYSERGPFKDHSVSSTLSWNVYELYTGGSLSASFGRSQGADFRSASLSQGIHPFRSVNLEGGGQFYRRIFPATDSTATRTDDSYQLRATLQYDISEEQAVSGRVIYSDSGTNGFVSYRQVVRRGTDFFVIYGDPSALTWRHRISLKAMVVLGG